MGRVKVSSLFILLLIVSFVTVVNAFWASSVTVEENFDTSHIFVGDFSLPPHPAITTGVGERFFDVDVEWWVLYQNSDGYKLIMTWLVHGSPIAYNDSAAMWVPLDQAQPIRGALDQFWTQISPDLQGLAVNVNGLNDFISQTDQVNISYPGTNQASYADIFILTRGEVEKYFAALNLLNGYNIPIAQKMLNGQLVDSAWWFRNSWISGSINSVGHASLVGNISTGMASNSYSASNPHGFRACLWIKG